MADVQPLDLGRQGEKALRAEEVTVGRGPRGLSDLERQIEIRMRRPRAVGEVATAPFRIQSVRDSDRFDQGRFAGAIFADKECDLGVKG
jgi:hypothetical protein